LVADDHSEHCVDEGDGEVHADQSDEDEAVEDARFCHAVLHVEEVDGEADLDAGEADLVHYVHEVGEALLVWAGDD
jgi:hypothetical protein